MASPRARIRKTSESERGEKSDADKKKLASGQAASKNGKATSPAHPKIRRGSSVSEQTNPAHKLDTKKRTTSGNDSKSTLAAKSKHTNEKTTAQNRSGTHSKSTKKPEVHKPQTNKKPEQDKNDPETEDQTETKEAPTTAVSENVESAPEEKSDDTHDQS